MREHINTPIESTDNKTVIQLIVFRAGNEEFGVKIEEVREIIKLVNVTPIPESPDFIKGIINVRGEIVTAIDIRSRFSLPMTEEIESKHIVVIKKDENLFGLIVDEVIEVLRIQRKEIKSAPPLIDRINEKYVDGIISHEERLIILLNLDRVLSQQDLVNVSSVKKVDMNESNKNDPKSLNQE
ncbi:MAG: chemotaxis protein CheW [Gammaproteobacteria bacterium]